MSLLRTGEPLKYPNEISAVAAGLPPLEIVQYFEEGPGNPTVTSDGRVIFSQHPFFAPFDDNIIIGEYKNGVKVAFPNGEWGTTPGTGGPNGITGSIGVRATPQGIVWIADTAGFMVGWNIVTDTLFKRIDVTACLNAGTSLIQDFAYDATRNHLYIADPDFGGANPQIIVVNIATSACRKVLVNDVSVRAEARYPLEANKKIVGVGLPQVAVDGITIDHKDEWVYFGAIQNTKLYRVKAEVLANSPVPAIPAMVEFYAEKPTCDGITIDANNNIYITDLANNGIGVIDGTTRKYRLLYQDDRLLSWPDGFGQSADGYIYCISNQLHLSATLNLPAATNASVPPYVLSRFKALGGTRVGN